jgi:hypothetical protein
MSDNGRYHRLELNGTRQFLAYAGYVNLLDKNVNTTNYNLFLNKKRWKGRKLKIYSPECRSVPEDKGSLISWKMQRSQIYGIDTK